MPPAKHTTADEAAFMANLLAGIDDAFFNAVPSPDRPPSSAQRNVSPSPCRNRGHVRSPLRNKPLIRTPAKDRKRQDGAEPTINSLLEGAEDWDWDDMNEDFMTPKKLKAPFNTSAITSSQGTTTSSSSRYASQSRSTSACGTPDASSGLEHSRATLTRCIVKEVRVRTDDLYYKELVVVVEPSSERRRVILQDDWFDMDVRADDVVNVIGTFKSFEATDHDLGGSSSSSSLSDSPPSITLTSKSSTALLILHPDVLITATSLSSTPTCVRKPILQSLVHSSSDVTPALVWGNMLHEVMQSCLVDWINDSAEWDQRELDRKIDVEVNRGLGDLLKLNISVEQAKRELKLRAIGLKAFHERYISDTPKPAAVLTNTRSERGQSSLLAINGLHDIEEDIWSPTYGLKGKLDVSVQAVIEDTLTKPTQNCPTSANDARDIRGRGLRTAESMTVATQRHPAPLELKTGRSTHVMEHRAQTMLYTLLMEERYAASVPSGLLYYTQSDEVVRVPRSTNELRALLLKRNEMAAYLARRMRTKRKGEEDAAHEQDLEDFLPPTIDDARVCGRCYVVDTCMLYRKAVESVDDTTSPIADIYSLKTSHLSQAQAQFFKEWENLISLEEHDLLRFRKELWTMTAKDREAHGRCYSDMVLDEDYIRPSATPRTASNREGKIHQYTYRFSKTSPGMGSWSKATSLLNGHMSVGDAVTVSIEPDLLALVRGFIVELSPTEVILGVDHKLTRPMILARRPQLAATETLIFRIDKDELFGGMGRIRGNLANLFYNDGDTKRLELVVDLRPPRFALLPSGPIVPSHEPVAKILASLNTNQEAAVRKVLSTLDYSIILGMPGTGKTTVIAALIRVLVCLGKTVLLTSYTHSAVDTILRKLTDIDFKVLRLGNIDKIHPDVHEFTLSKGKFPTTIEQLERQVMSPPVVATTCLSIDHPLFTRRKFDYCIVDEASQVTLPTCLGPLRYADKFVLVGDHFQLPPLVRNREAKRRGLEVSLFRRLSEAHPEAVVDLNEQYRMNEDIMVLSNRLIYSDRLRCGSDAVATHSLRLPSPKYMDSIHASPVNRCVGTDCWIERLLDENCKAVFVDTDNVPAQDSRVGELTHNVVEAALVRQVAESLIGSGIVEEDIGIITLYRQQIKLLSHLLQDQRGIEILTADRSQGRDKECIIVSMVRSNDEGQVGDLLKDWRRINVAFTRARSKLIIIGSRKTLQGQALLQEFFKLMDSKGWILALPPDADKLHAASSSPRKRPIADNGRIGEEITSPSRLAKRPRKSGVIEEGLLKGRYILKDLLNDTA